ncbi:MAG: RNA-binding protein Hfq, partial [uncultured Lysobacter sp.]
AQYGQPDGLQACDLHGRARTQREGRPGWRLRAAFGRPGRRRCAGCGLRRL